MTAKRPPKKAPADAGAPKPLRLGGAPREVGPAWSLSEWERERFDRSYGVSRHAANVLDVHDQDRELLWKSLGATLGFHELSKIIDSLEFDDGFDDLQHELEMVRVAFELALQALDMALGERAKQFDRQRSAALARVAKDPKSQAMAGVREEFERWQAGVVSYRSQAEFARAMLDQFEVLDSHTAIENSCRKWRAESRHRAG